jgi:hypothetical protein
MSEMVHYKGTLTKVELLEYETLEEQCKRVYKKLTSNTELKKYYDTYEEMLLDEFYKEYILIDNELYTTNRKDVGIDSSLFTSKINEDGTIDYEVLYYNGGCGFTEAIEEALKNKM